MGRYSRYSWGLMGLLILLGGCASTPAKFMATTGFVTTAHDPLLDKNGGVLLLADVCIRRGSLIRDNYVVVTESKAGAKTLVNEVHDYLSTYGVQVRATLIPFACGAWQDSKNSLQNVANNLDDSVREGQQPFDVSEDLKSDRDYVHALTTVATYAFQHPLAPGQNTNRANPAVSLVTVEQFRAASVIVMAKTKASSILYIGVSGLSRTAGQNVLRGTGSILIGTAVGMATLGAGAGVGLIVMPGPVGDSRLMSATVINLETAEVRWSNIVSAPGDPIKPDVVANQSIVDMLLSGLVRRPASMWSPPGIPSAQ